MAETCREMKMQ